MKKNVYVIFDEEAHELLPPFFANNDESALRMVKNSIKAHQFKNMNLDMVSLRKICTLDTESVDRNMVEICESHFITDLNTLVDDEVKNKWDNEALAQSMTKCFEMALTKFLNENKKE